MPLPFNFRPHGPAAGSTDDTPQPGRGKGLLSLGPKKHAFRQGRGVVRDVIRGFLIPLRFALACGLVVFLAGALLAFRLSEGPVSLGGLVASLEQGLNEALAPVGLSLTVDGADFSWSSLDVYPRIGFHGVDVLDLQGRRIAHIPDIVAVLSVRKAFRGELPLRSVEIDRPVVRLIRHANGSLDIVPNRGMGEDPDAPDGDVSPAPGALAPLVLDDTGLIGRIQDLVDHRTLTLVLRDGTLGFRDEQTGGAFDLADVMVRLDVRKDAVQGRLSAMIDPPENLGEDLGGDWAEDRAGFSVDVLTRAQTRDQVSAVVSVQSLTPALVERAVLAFAPPEGADDLVQAIRSVQGEVTATVSATVSVPALLATPVNGEDDLTALRSALLHGVFQVSAQDLRIDGALLGARDPFAVQALDVDGIVGAALDEVRIDGLRVDPGDGADVRGQAVVGGLFGDPAVQVSLKVNALKVRRLIDLWPPFAAPNARVWLDENMIDGLVDTATLSVGAAGSTWDDMDLTELSGGGTVRDAALWYLKPLPPLEGVNGDLVFQTETISGTLSSGRFRGLDHLSLTDGTFTFTGINGTRQDARIKSTVTGNLSSVLALLDSDPFGYAGRVGIDPKAAGGTFQGTVGFEFPLLADLYFADVRLGADIALQDARLPRIFRGQDLSEGNLTLVLTEQGMDIDGTARLGPVPLQVAWRENFGDAPFASRYGIKATVTNAARRALGFDLPVGGSVSVDGPIGVDATVTVVQKGKTQIDAKIDLGKTALAVTPLGWEKPTTKPGTLVVKGNLTGAKGMLTAVFNAGADAQIKARLALNTKSTPKPSRLDVDTFLLGANRLRGFVVWGAQGQPDIRVTEGNLDLRSLFARSAPTDRASVPPPEPAGDKAPNLPAFRLQAFLSVVRLEETVFLDQLTVTAAHSGTGFPQVKLTSTIRDAGPLQATLDPAAKGAPQTFVLTSKNAGALLKGFGVIETIRGGDLTVSGTLASSGCVDATIRVTGFRLMNTPILVRIVSIAGLTGIVDAFRGPGLGFDRLRAPFTFCRSVLTLKNASAHGASIGLTAAGSLNFKTDALRMDGTLIPAYALNSAIGYIPLIGDLLLGGEDHGLFAVNYTVTGTMEDPSVSVNPLSFLAPGFLRGIFDIFSKSE